MAHDTNAGAWRGDTALSATFIMPGLGLVVRRIIQLDFYCRSLSIRALAVVGGPPRPVAIAYSREALDQPADNGGGFDVIFSGAPAYERFFWRDDEGPPYIWLFHRSVGATAIHFSYFPTKKRDGNIPMPSRANEDYPAILETTALIVPGV